MKRSTKPKPAQPTKFKFGYRVRLLRQSLSIGVGGETGTVISHTDYADRVKVRFDSDVLHAMGTVKQDTWWALSKDLEPEGTPPPLVEDSRDYLNAVTGG